VQLAGDEPTVWCKLEFLNPSGSTKDRIARFILEKAWRRGRLRRASSPCSPTGWSATSRPSCSSTRDNPCPAGGRGVE
jgi:threonine synthase